MAPDIIKFTIQLRQSLHKYFILFLVLLSTSPTLFIPLLHFYHTAVTILICTQALEKAIFFYTPWPLSRDVPFDWNAVPSFNHLTNSSSAFKNQLKCLLLCNNSLDSFPHPFSCHSCLHILVTSLYYSNDETVLWSFFKMSVLPRLWVILASTSNFTAHRINEWMYAIILYGSITPLC